MIFDKFRTIIKNYEEYQFDKRTTVYKDDYLFDKEEKIKRKWNHYKNTNNYSKLENVLNDLEKDINLMLPLFKQIVSEITILLKEQNNASEEFNNFINKFENFLENIIKENPYEMFLYKEDKLKIKWDYYKEKKNYAKLDEVIVDMEKYSLQPPSYFKDMKEELLLLIAKDDKKLAQEYIGKYQLKFDSQTLKLIMKKGNVETLELFMMNPLIKFEKNSKTKHFIIEPSNIARLACETKNMEFFKFACSFPNQDSTAYETNVQFAIVNNWHPGIEYIGNNYKDKISLKGYQDLADFALNEGSLSIAEYLKTLSPEGKIDIPNGSLQQKVKQLREESFSKADISNTLKN